jgi:orotidine-5'-phosphate decarboxylase
MTFIEKLRKSAKETGSIACMGLDPVLGAMPKRYGSAQKIPHFLREVMAEMDSQKVFAGAFKPNQGFYVRHNRIVEKESEHYDGNIALARVIRTIRSYFEGVPVCLDYKRGDIAKSSDNYAVEGFDVWGADVVTVHPYMGFDSVLPFAGRNPKDLEQAARYCNDEAGKGVYVLVRTSNKGAKDFQDLRVTPDKEVLEKIIDENTLGEVPKDERAGHLADAIREGSMPFYMAVAHKVIDWAKDNPGVGAVVGATYIEELEEIAKLIVSSGVEVPLLIPGVGGQGGSAKDVVAVLRDTGYDLSLARINSSSGITHPWVKKKEVAPDDHAKVCVASLAKLNEQIGYDKAA